MNPYELYKQELIQQVVKKEVDAFYLIDYVIELCQKIDELDYRLNNNDI
ncbi:hypothetical protein P9B03_11865 [Metasolibacillus meyeri]|uniref:Uncharacterized protein n=1 Tax=Metasolibacillus meyeri TaxID=1071052 RepID=A0AAW9NNQ4_9BACL|nr:hypothetical protein [Metasolibacillus meyeri]MEC1179182.1 hypothetical protein [Metasolibacillus meyeri]